MKTWLFNPFKYIAGNKALLLGITIMLVSAIICLFSTEHLDGVIDVHVGRVTPGWSYFIEPMLDWICLALPLYIFGRFFSPSSIRFIDVAGTSALARYPMFFVVIISLIVPKDIGTDPQKIISTIESTPSLLARLVIAGLFVIPLTVWTVALMYNAYSVSANLKGAKAAWSFVVSFIIAEILSKLILYSLI